MVTTAGTAALGAVRDRIDGQVLLPGEDGYDRARTVWNAMIDRRPAVIVRCASVGDVVTAVRTARELDLEIGVRCGGHSVVGQAVPEAGLMIDLSSMGGVRVDPERRTALVQGGALLGSLDRESQRHGLATTAGNVSHTGVGGLTLGGGMGWLARQHGLTCDNVESFEVVTADGSIVRASPTDHPDLFWGLRGGGGNFGVVTEFQFRLHPVGTRALVVGLSFPLDQAQPVVRGWRDLNAEAPRPATFTLTVAPDGLVTVGYVWVGDPDEGRRLLPSLQALGRPTSESVVEMAYVDLQLTDDMVRGHSLRHYWKGHYLRSLPDEAIEALLLRGTQMSPATSSRLPAYRPTAERSLTSLTRTPRSATATPCSSTSRPPAGATRTRTRRGSRSPAAAPPRWSPTPAACTSTRSATRAPPACGARTRPTSCAGSARSRPPTTPTTCSTSTPTSRRRGRRSGLLPRCRFRRVGCETAAYAAS
jgi:hypothetical protein